MNASAAANVPPNDESECGENRISHLIGLIALIRAGAAYIGEKKGPLEELHFINMGLHSLKGLGVTRAELYEATTTITSYERRPGRADHALREE